MSHWHFDSPDPETSQAIAAELGRAIGERGLAISLVGPLGAGKTVFVKGLGEGLGVDPRLVSSPTFVIAQQYPILRDANDPGPELLYHVDLYRLESEHELDEIGFDDALRAGVVVAAEWADRFPGVLGPERLELEFEGPSALYDSDAADEEHPGVVPDEESQTGKAASRGRRVEVTARGEAAERILEDWRERVERSERLASKTSAESGSVGEGTRALRATGLVAALAFWASGSAMFAQSDAMSPCEVARSIDEDAWGTRRVVCVSSSHVDEEVDERTDGQSAAEVGLPTGVGGLLFGRPIELDSATQAMLEALPGIGPARAEAILESRGRAPFARLLDLERVRGIGPRTREALSRWLTTTGPRDGASVGDSGADAAEAERSNG